MVAQLLVGQLMVCHMTPRGKQSAAHLFWGLSNHKSGFYKYDFMRNTFVSTVPRNLEDVFYVWRKNLTNSPFSHRAKSLQLFKCSSGELVSIKTLHDGIADCGDGEDESGLICFVNGKLVNSSHCENSCFRPNCLCAELYYHNNKGGCSPYRLKQAVYNILFFDENKQNDIKNVKSINIYNLMVSVNKTEYDIQTNDLIINKNFTLKNDIVLQNDCTKEKLGSGAKQFVQNCENPDEIQCTYGCARCFPLHKLCVYELDHHGNMMHCPSGAHLKNCGQIQCNNMFRCSYCIPYR